MTCKYPDNAVSTAYKWGCRCTACVEGAARRNSLRHTKPSEGDAHAIKEFLAQAVCELPPTSEWVGGAACGGKDPRRWFPWRGDAVPAAIAVCSGCPVSARCLWAALVRDEEFGVWGGVSRNERVAIARDLSRLKAASAAAVMESSDLECA